MAGIISPETLAKSGTEHGHQCAVMQWSVLNRKRFDSLELLFAIPNGGDRQRHVAATMVAEGVKSGVPDLCLPVPKGRFAGLWIEMKRQGYSGRAQGARSDNQVKWHLALIGQHYAVVTCYGWEAAVAAIKDYYAGMLVMPEGGDCEFYGE